MSLQPAKAQKAVVRCECAKLRWMWETLMMWWKLKVRNPAWAEHAGAQALQVGGAQIHELCSRRVV